MSRYVIETTVQGILEHTRRQYVGGIGKDSMYEYPFVGWFAHFKGSHEALCLSTVRADRPNLNSGDKVRITIERID